MESDSLVNKSLPIIKDLPMKMKAKIVTVTLTDVGSIICIVGSPFHEFISNIQSSI